MIDCFDYVWAFRWGLEMHVCRAERISMVMFLFWVVHDSASIIPSLAKSVLQRPASILATVPDISVDGATSGEKAGGVLCPFDLRTTRLIRVQIHLSRNGRAQLQSRF